MGRDTSRQDQTLSGRPVLVHSSCHPSPSKLSPTERGAQPFRNTDSLRLLGLEVEHCMSDFSLDYAASVGRDFDGDLSGSVT